MAQPVKNKTSIHKAGSLPGLAQWGKGSGVAVRYGIGRRLSSDLGLLGLWLWLEAAALIGPLAWKLPYAAGTAVKKKKRRRKSKLNAKYPQ